MWNQYYYFDLPKIRVNRARTVNSPLPNHHSIPNLGNVPIIEFGACLTFLMCHFYQFMIDVYSQTKNQKYMELTKIDNNLQK